MTDPVVVPFRARPVRQAGDLEGVCRLFLGHIQSRGYARNTLTAYAGDLGQLLGYCQARGVALLQHVSGALLDDWVAALVQGEGVSHRTAARKLQTVRALGRFAVGRGIIQRNPYDDAAPIRWQARRVIAPETGSLLAMIAAIPDDTPLGIRDRAMLRLMFDAALRVSALCALDVYDPQRPAASTVTPAGDVPYLAKGGRQEVSCCDETTLAYIDRWLAVRHHFERRQSPPALFLTQRGERPTRAGVAARVKSYGAAAGMGHLHAHMLRHRRGGDVLERVGLREASLLLGHATPRTTLEVYGHQAAEKLRRRIRSEAPLEAARPGGAA